MTKEVQLTIRIEPELRDAFGAATAADHRPAAQVLRELMRGYVERSLTPKAQSAAVLATAARERQRREDEVRFARASVALEGLTPLPETAALDQQYIDGRIKIEDFVRLNVAAAKRHQDLSR